MNSSNLVSAIRGPLMLITVGTLFAVDRFGPGDLGITRTWPAILIMWGLLLLADRAAGKSETKIPTQTSGGQQ
jgi:hypothetical protein